jgi:UDP-galactopyranose mutase
MLKKMASNPLVKISLRTDFFEIEHSIPKSALCIYSGPIDRYFNYQHGMLNWRTLDFEFQSLEMDDFQGTSVVNYADMDAKFTRIHEFKHLHPERENTSGRTIIAREYSRFALSRNDEPYYPVNSTEDKIKLEKYRKDSLALKNVIFGGRLGSYKYLDMHMAIASAHSVFDNKVSPWIKQNFLLPPG